MDDPKRIVNDNVRQPEVVTTKLQEHKLPVDNRNKVVITDIQIPFNSMVGLIVKFALAAIPALLILAGAGAIGFMIIHGTFLK